MRPARLSASLLACALSVAVVTGCGDDPAGPDPVDGTADRLAHLADSLGASGDITTVMALHMASDALRAGASLQQIGVTLDGTTSAWTAVATQLTLSDEACAQLLDGLPGTIPDAESFCAPSQFTVAWRGARPELTSLLSFAGDTGTVSFDFGFGVFEGEPGGFGFSMLRDLGSDVLWFADSGSARSVVQASGGACPRRLPPRSIEIEMECTLERYGVTLAARYGGLAGGQLPLDPSSPPDEEPMLPPRRASIATQSVGGMHLHVVRYPDMPSLQRRGATTAGSREPAAFPAARLLLAR